MISIKPKWCELIANGKKTIEPRKTRPKIETPFKCYIYCTQEKYKNKYLHTSNKKNRLLFWHNNGDCEIVCEPEHTSYTAYSCNGKVIGEFVCDAVIPISIEYSNPKSRIALKEFPYTCLTDKQIMDYLGNGGKGYGWHISDLKIYDKPKELSEFYVIDKGSVKRCEYRQRAGQPEYKTCNGGWIKGTWICTKDSDYTTWCENCITRNIKRPPQSWCYVEELK